MASEATKMAVIDNMHIHVRVFEFTEFNYEVRSDLRGYIIVSPLVFRAIALLLNLAAIVRPDQRQPIGHSRKIQALFTQPRTSLLVKLCIAVTIWQATSTVINFYQHLCQDVCITVHPACKVFGCKQWNNKQ